MLSDKKLDSHPIPFDRRAAPTSLRKQPLVSFSSTMVLVVTYNPLWCTFGGLLLYYRFKTPTLNPFWYGSR